QSLRPQEEKAGPMTRAEMIVAASATWWCNDMPTDLSLLLVVGVSSRALFDMEEANRVYETEGLDAYVRYQVARADEELAPGTGFPLIRALLALNKKTSGPRKAEVVIMSRTSPETSLRMFESIKRHGLDIQR